MDNGFNFSLEIFFELIFTASKDVGYQTKIDIWN